MNLSGIYTITNTANNKMYVGSAVHINNRFGEHKKLLKKGAHHSVKLQRAWDKYGAESFQFHPMLICAKADLIFFEQRAIDAFKAVSFGYNVSPTAGNTLGVRFSDESKKKISIALTGKKNRLGAVLSDETKRKISASNTGKTLSDVTKTKIGAANIGKIVSDETKRRMSDSAKNLSAEFKKNRGLSNIGKIHSDATKAKISIARRIRSHPKHSEESKMKMSIAQTGLMKKSNTSGFVGVRWNERLKKWSANIGRVYLGVFSNKDDAIAMVENCKSAAVDNQDDLFAVES